MFCQRVSLPLSERTLNLHRVIDEPPKSSLRVSYPTSHIHLPTWIYPQISSKISDTLWYLWLARSTAVSHPFPFGPSMVGSRPPFSVQTCESHSPISSVAESSQHSCDHLLRSTLSGESVSEVSMYVIKTELWLMV